MCDNLLRTDSLVRTFIYYRPVFQSQHYEHAEYSRLTEITTTATCLCNRDACLTKNDYVTALDTSRHSRRQDQLILLLRPWHQFTVAQLIALTFMSLCYSCHLQSPAFSKTDAHCRVRVGSCVSGGQCSSTVYT